MKLPDFLQHAGLNGLRRQMGANRLGDLKLTADPNRLTEHELYLLAHGGIDLKSLDDLRILPDGTLALKDSRVLLYIRDVTFYRREAMDETRTLPRFHFANCATLRQMQSEGRFAKYVVAARQDGLFEVNIVEDNRVVRSSPEPLNVCQNCLTHISFNGFSMSQSRQERTRQVAAFRLVDFFEQFPRALIVKPPGEKSDSAPLNIYPADFERLATRTKNQRGWRCEKCSIVLTDPNLRGHLHVHHKNGQKSDSRPENLEVLCLWCHAQEPQHAHMCNTPEYSGFERIRNRMLNKGNEARDHDSSLDGGSDSVDAFVKFATVHRLSYQDYRDRNGAFWIQVPPGSQYLVQRLMQLGFQYREGRGWWHK